MPFTDWKFPTSNELVTNQDDNWVNADNAYADDGSVATVAVSGGDFSDLRRWAGFGFDTDDIPSGATILGVEVEIEKERDGGDAMDDFVGIYDPGNGASPSIIKDDTSFFGHTVRYGGAGMLWGSSSISDSDVRDSDFGVQVEVESFITEATFEMDYIRVRVYYRDASTGVANPVPVLEGFQASNSSGSEVDSLLAVAPGSITAGETLFIVAGTDDDEAYDADRLKIDDTDWIRIGVEGDDATDSKIGIWMIPNATGSETDVTINNAGSNEVIAWYLRVSGVDTDDPLDSITFSSESGSTSHSLAGLTTERNNCLLFTGLVFDGGDGAPFTTPGGWTEQDEETSGTGSNDVSGVFATKSKATAGIESAAVFTSSASDGSSGFMMAIKPSQLFGPQITSMNTVLGIEIDSLNTADETEIDFINSIDV